MDIGANIGMFALFLSIQSPGIRICCFEPSTKTRETLIRNISDNSLSNTVATFGFALSDPPGIREFCLTPRSTDQRLTRGRDDPLFPLEKVECITLEQAIALTGAARIDFLKLDIEGAELEVLEAASDTVWNKIARIALEFHEDIAPGCARRIETLLRRHGFEFTKTTSPPYRDTCGILRAARIAS
jgi:FkbM family methyltransferase